MKSRAALTIIVAAVAGAAVWGLSPALTDRAEPWDAEGPFYAIALVVAGLVAGVVMPKPLWAHYAGSVVGQAGYELLFLQVGPLFVLGVAFLLGYSVLFLVGAFVGARARVRFG